MALARRAVVSPTTFRLPLLQVPFEQMYAQMQQYQLEKDQAGALSSLMPKYINADAEDATRFRDLTQRLSQVTTDAFASGNTSEAIRTMRQAQGEIKKQWQPGGLANALQSRFDQYAGATKSIEDATKNNQSSVYGDYYRNQLEQSVNKGVGYDPATGRFNSIAAPQVGKEVILGDEVDTFLKGWMADKGVQITKSPDGMWYNKVTNESVSPDELKSALGQFYQQPHIQQALGVYGWDRSRRMDPDVARQKYSKQITDQLNGQSQMLKGLQAQLKSGNKRQILEIQQDLKAQGYNIDADGVAGPATQSALEDYVNKTMVDHNQIRASIPQQLAGIDPMQFAIEDLKGELTNTYVPKYAYTKRDIDMIANQPAIAQMRIKAQQSAMAGLKAMLFPPTATLMSPVATSQITVGTISQQYGDSKKSYKQLESSVLSSLTPEMKKVVGSYLAGSSSNGGDAYKASQVLFTAAQAATKNGKYDPKAFVRSLEQQNISMTEAEMNRHAMFFQNENNRGVLTGMHDQLQPAAQGMKIAEEMFEQYRDQALKSNKIDWGKVASIGFIGTRAGGIAGAYTGAFYPDAQAAKRAYEAGDPQVIRALNEHVGKLSIRDQSQIFKSENAINLVLNEKLKPFEQQLHQLAKTNMAALVDYTTMDKAQLARLGMDKKGNVLLDENGKRKINIESAQIGTTVVNGKASPVLLMKTSGMQAPIAVPMNSMNPQYVSTLVNNIAALGINPNNPADITDPATLDAAVVMRFDMDQDEGTGFSAKVAHQRMVQNRPGQIGNTIVRTSRGTSDLQTFVVRDKGGSGSYLVTTSSEAEATKLRKDPVMDVRDYQKSDNSWVVKLDGTYQGVNTAIHATKAALYRDEVIGKAFAEPYNVTRQPSNQTANPNILMSALEMMGGEF